MKKVAIIIFEILNIILILSWFIKPSNEVLSNVIASVVLAAIVVDVFAVGIFVISYFKSRRKKTLWEVRLLGFTFIFLDKLLNFIEIRLNMKYYEKIIKKRRYLYE